MAWNLYVAKLCSWKELVIFQNVHACSLLCLHCSPGSMGLSGNVLCEGESTQLCLCRAGETGKEESRLSFYSFFWLRWECLCSSKNTSNVIFSFEIWGEYFNFLLWPLVIVVVIGSFQPCCWQLGDPDVFWEEARQTTVKFVFLRSACSKLGFSW